MFEQESNEQKELSDQDQQQAEQNQPPINTQGSPFMAYSQTYCPLPTVNEVDTPSLKDNKSIHLSPLKMHKKQKSAMIGDLGELKPERIKPS